MLPLTVKVEDPDVPIAVKVRAVESGVGIAPVARAPSIALRVTPFGVSQVIEVPPS